MRPSWESHWMREAYLAAEMSTCASGREVGAVAVRNNRSIVTGVNGVPTEVPHPLTCTRRDQGIPSGEALWLCGCIHAELNLICNAAREGVSLQNTTVYVTCHPCGLCAGALANAGVTAVIFDGPYPNSNSVHLPSLTIRSQECE
jgi:dCMP deaminase